MTLSCYVIPCSFSSLSSRSSAPSSVSPSAPSPPSPPRRPSSPCPPLPSCPCPSRYARPKPRLPAFSCRIAPRAPSPGQVGVQTSSRSNSAVESASGRAQHQAADCSPSKISTRGPSRYPYQTTVFQNIVSAFLLPTVSVIPGTTFQVLDQLPLLGDTTSNQAILFSHPFLPVPNEQPSFPNYTLPPANLSAPDIPSAIPNLTLVMAPTSAQLTTLPQTACALLNTSSTGSINSNDPWLRSSVGWRSQWLVEGLSPSTNYTAYVIQDTLKVSGPIYFATKSGKSLLLSSSPSDDAPISKLPLSACILSPLLSRHRIRRAITTITSPRVRLQRHFPPRRHLLAAPPIHVQFHYHALHVCMRARSLLTSPNLRRLSNPLPHMALQRLLPSLF